MIKFMKYAWLLLAVPVLAQGAGMEPDREVVYKSIDGVELKLHVFEPEELNATDKRPAIVFFFGGGWNGGDPKQFYQQARFFADQGLVSFSAEYRVKSRNKTTPFECVKDAKSAVRWVREHANELGLDPDRIIAAGGSAGGHIAGCTGVIDGCEEAGENMSISSEPNLMILFNPVLDTTEKGYGANKFSPEQQTNLSLCHQVKSGIVPTLVFHGTTDTTVPYENAERFTRLMKEAGNECVLVPFEGKSHGFFNGAFFRARNGDDDFNETMKHSVDFLSVHGFSTVAAESSEHSSKRRPNILLIIADDLGDRLACYGDSLAVTPSLDALAQKGVVFGNAYCQYHTCGPSRGSLMSGRYPFETGYTHNRGGTYSQYLPNLTSLPRLFRDNGYKTARVGKIFHMGIPAEIGGAGTDDPGAWDVAINNTGWDAVEANWMKATSWGTRDGPGVRIRYSAPEIDDGESADGQGLSEAIKLLEQHHPRKTGKPFFLAYGIYRPHPPMIVPKQHWDAIDPARIVLPDVPENDRDDIPQINWHRRGTDYNFIPEEHARNYTHAYYAATHFVDALAGKLIQALGRQGLADNTIIIFTGDQGFMLGEHGHWHKSSMFEESQRVPLIIVDPRAKEKGKQVSGLVGLVDVYPTLCDLAEITPKHELSGMSLKPQLNDVSAITKLCEFIMGSPGGYTIRTEKYAYTEWRKGQKKTGDAMLYDLEKDPQQFTNLIQDPTHQTIREELAQRLNKRIQTERM